MIFSAVIIFVFRRCKGRGFSGRDKHIFAEMVGFALIFDVGQKMTLFLTKEHKIVSFLREKRPF